MSLAFFASVEFSIAQLFYYGTTEKVPLTLSLNKIVVKYSIGAKGQTILRNLGQYGKAESISERVYAVTLKDPSKRGQILDTLKKDKDVVAANPIYLTRDNQEMGVTDEICLEFNKDVKETEKQKLLSSFNAVEIPRTRPWEKFFSIITVGKDKDALAVANRIKESGLVKFAHPNFISRTYMHSHIPNDPFFPKQFYLHNTGQTINDGHSGTYDADIDAPEAWDITKGSSAIKIAVIDEGVERHNNDLPASRLVVLSGSNFASGSPNDPEAVGDGAHGTCCAGIIAAEQDNSEGVTGIAPLCKIMPVRIPFGSGYEATYADAINFAWTSGADVLSNSWGYHSNVDIPVITAAIQNAITLGRGGLGSVVVWSAGNTANHAAGNNGYVSYPGCVAVANVLTVGASDRYDRQANYSPTGAGIDIVAPSHRAYSFQITGESYEVWSTDIVGTAGYNPAKQTDGGLLPPVGEVLPSSGTNYLDYTGRMGGTSAACPEVAGVAALMLSVNPTLTPAQVFDCITHSADKVGGYTYTSGRCNEMGFGRLNAFNSLSVQLWMKDTPNDPGTEPNPTTDLMYLSDDVWVRKINDGGLIHQDAEYRDPSNGIPNAVYVRVRNAGNLLGSGTLKLYWAKAGLFLDWPKPWDGSVTVPAQMGNPIDTKSTGTVAANSEVIIPFEWYPPNPANYSMFGTEQFHFCLLARIENGITFPETGDLAGNVRNNNNIVWKNIAVKDDVSGDIASSGMLIANYSRKEELTRIIFTIPKEEERMALYRYGNLTVTLSDKLYNKWREAGGKSQGFKPVGKELQISSPNTWIGDFVLKPNEIYGLQVRYKMTNKPKVERLEGFAFNFDVQKLVLIKEKWQLKGGQRYQFYPLKREKQ